MIGGGKWFEDGTTEFSARHGNVFLVDEAYPLPSTPAAPLVMLRYQKRLVLSARSVAIVTTSAFEPFGLQHWLAASVTLALSVAVPLVIRGLASSELQETLRRVVALCLLAHVVIGLVVKTRVYGLPLREHLPLHLCGASLIFGALMLWLRSYRLYEVVYFWGTGGALVALLTPSLQHGFPHPLFVLFFLGHGLALTAVMFATIVCGFRPRDTSVLIALAATAAYAGLIYPLNLALGSNYLYLSHKPAQPSPLDYFGPWPWYLLGLCAITVGTCLLCYLPFAVGGRLSRARMAQSSSTHTQSTGQM
jgi:hypothetical integral membrane protein (TIGR02206 family)